ncbi:MAG: sugar phosphate isomerase/epimerase [Opitutaceae bacterium]|jgi:sugar phosphate isomerase/epimerase|nr:sugar phosphate isomerase/epimerase [Opitutaceae bacterium]
MTTPAAATATAAATTIASRLAVCTWSLEPANARDLLDKLAAVGLARIQLALDPLNEAPEAWADVAALIAQNNITPLSGMVRCLGEDYTTLESIRRTGGIAPDATWGQNLENFRRCAAIAANLRLPLVTLHAGFLPHKAAGPGYEKMLGRLQTVADLFARESIALGLETGQETAAELADFLKTLNHPGVGVNFDPANMILYGKGDPVDAVRVLAPWLRQVHVKDATRATTPGEWGEEVPVGRGHVDWPGFLAALREAGYRGELVIEREAGTQRIADIRAARIFLETTRAHTNFPT